MSEVISKSQEEHAAQIEILNTAIAKMKSKLKGKRSKSLGAVNEKVDKKTSALQELLSSTDSKIILMSKQIETYEAEQKRNNLSLEWYKTRYHGAKSNSMARVDLDLMKLEHSGLQNQLTDVLKKNHELGVKVTELTAALQNLDGMKKFGRVHGNRAPGGGYSEEFEEQALSMLATGKLNQMACCYCSSS